MEAILQEYFSKQVYQLSVYSLQKITLTRITTFLCQTEQLNDLITEFEYENVYRIRTGEEFIKVKAKANELISKLPAIGIYKEMILDFLWPIAFKMILWKQLYSSTISNEFLRQFYFTDQGRIDSKRTAKYLIANEMIPVEKRFKLACKLFLIEDMCKMWETMPWNLKIDLIDELSKTNIPLTTAWLNALKDLKKITARDMIELLIYAIIIGSLEALKHLFSIIPYNMKNNWAIICFEFVSKKLGTQVCYPEEQIDLVFFILSQLSTEGKEIVFTTHFLVVLSLLLYSSDRNLFLDAWKFGLHFASVDDIERVLLQIFVMYSFEVYRDLDYRMLFVSAWRLLPASVKDIIRKESNLGFICFRELIKEDFKFILQEGSSTNISNLIALNLKSSPSTIYLTFKQDKWNFLYFLIGEEIITTEMLSVKKGRDFPEDGTKFLACVDLINYICDKKNEIKKSK